VARKLEIYKCEVCGNIVEVLHGGVGKLVCCGQPMRLMERNAADAAHEKHVPVIKGVEGGFAVKVGDAPHPMLEEHYIEWIELVAGDRAYRLFLKPDDAPEAAFLLEEKDVTARGYCNLHGLWEG